MIYRHKTRIQTFTLKQTWILFFNLPIKGTKSVNYCMCNAIRYLLPPPSQRYFDYFQQCIFIIVILGPGKTLEFFRFFKYLKTFQRYSIMYNVNKYVSVTNSCCKNALFQKDIICFKKLKDLAKIKPRLEKCCVKQNQTTSRKMLK